jgi:hypothetical protein
MSETSCRVGAIHYFAWAKGLQTREFLRAPVLSDFNTWKQCFQPRHSWRHLLSGRSADYPWDDVFLESQNQIGRTRVPFGRFCDPC